MKELMLHLAGAADSMDVACGETIQETGKVLGRVEPQE